MTPTPQQTARVESLMGDYLAVGHIDLGRNVSVIARQGDGVAHAEVIDREGQPLDRAHAVRDLASRRATWLRMASQATDHLIAELALAQADGYDLNLTEVARDAGVARQTLYNRLAELDVDPNR